MAKKPQQELTGHGRVICKKCKKVIITCKCMKCSENVKYSICSDCSSK